MRGRLRRGPTDERGVFAVMLAIVITLLVVLLALVLDLGYARQIQRQEQNAADAGALAGVRELQDTINFAAAKSVALEYAEANLGAGSYTVTVESPYDLAGSSVSPSQLVYVNVCADLDTWFAGTFGVDSLRPCANAVGATRSTVTIGRGVIVLDPADDRALHKQGNATLTVNGGDVLVNSSDGAGAQCDSTNGGIFTTGGGNTYLSSSSYGGGDCLHEGDPIYNVPPTPDPLAKLPTPSTAGLPVFPGGNYSGTIDPGVYTGPVVTDGPNPLTLNPGNYIFQGGFKCSGQAGKQLNGNGVFLYIGHGDDNGDGLDDGNPYTLSSDQNSSTVAPKFIQEGNCLANLVAPSGGTYEQILLFQARCNPNESRLAGNGSSLTGAIYIPCGKLRIAGNGTLALEDTMLVTNYFNVAGEGNFTMNIKEPPQAEPRDTDVWLES